MTTVSSKENPSPADCNRFGTQQLKGNPKPSTLTDDLRCLRLNHNFAHEFLASTVCLVERASDSCRLQSIWGRDLKEITPNLQLFLRTYNVYNYYLLQLRETQGLLHLLRMHVLHSAIDTGELPLLIYFFCQISLLWYLLMTDKISHWEPFCQQASLETKFGSLRTISYGAKVIFLLLHLEQFVHLMHVSLNNMWYA